MACGVSVLMLHRILQEARSEGSDARTSPASVPGSGSAPTTTSEELFEQPFSGREHIAQALGASEVTTLTVTPLASRSRRLVNHPSPISLERVCRLWISGAHRC